MSKTAPGKRKIRVLVVDDFAETRENVRKLLFFEDDIEVVGTASNGKEGVELAANLQPDIVLMDINMPGMDGIAASEAISAQLPNVQVVMMSVQGEADYLRRSMLAGAREFLIKPFSGEELVNSLRRVHQLAATRLASVPAPPPPTHAFPPPAEVDLARVIVVLGTKGGVGASTIAVNLAVALRDETNERVALVDANLEFGDVGVLLNLPGTHSIADLAGNDVEIDEEMLTGVMVDHSSGIRVLLAPPRPEMAELVTLPILKRGLEVMRGMFDYIIVDLWKSFQESMVFLLDASDQIILISTLDIPAVKNTKLFFELADALGYSQEKTILVLNKEDGRSGVNAKDVQASIKHPIHAVIAKDDKATTLALNRGTPFVLTQRSIPISQTIVGLARLISKNRREAVPEKLAPPVAVRKK